MTDTVQKVYVVNQATTIYSGTVSISGTVAATQSGTWNINNISGTVSLPTGAATSAKQDAEAVLIGAVNETAPGTDTASSGLNGRLQRIAQRITSLIALIPSSLGQKADAASLAVTLSTEQAGGKITAATMPTGGTGILGWLSGIWYALTRTGVTFADSANFDAFGRLRTSSTQTMMDSTQYYGDDPLIWENSTTGGGAAVTFLSNESTIQMATGATTNGNKVIRQTRKYIRYKAGKSQLILLTFNMNTAVTNVRRRAGYFDDNDGVFLERSTSDVSINLRTSTSGSPVTDSVAQASWNIDPFDGTGPSGITLDLAKAQILVIDAQWLGVGRVRVGFDIDGIVYWAHHYRNANSKTTVYMKRGALPIRFEIENVGTASSNSSMRQICCVVMSEGDEENGKLRQFTASNGTTTIGVTTRRPVLSVRAATTGPNSVRNIGALIPNDFELTASTNSAYWEIVLNGTLTGAAFAAVNSTYSLAEYDTAATAITGGIVVHSGFVVAGSGSTRASVSNELRQQLELVYSTLGNVQDTVTIVAKSFTGTSNLSSVVNWKEWGLA